MTYYQPAVTVLPECTDEALRANTVYQGEVADLLLRVPDVWRQPVEAEVRSRAYRTRFVDTAGGPMAVKDAVRDVDEVRREVVAEVLAQLAREAVAR